MHGTIISSFMHFVGGGSEYKHRSLYDSRMKAFFWIVFSLIVGAFAWWSVGTALTNIANFRNTYTEPFEAAYRSNDPMVIATKLNEGIANMESIGYDTGYANIILPGTPTRNLGILTQNLRQIAARAQKIAAETDAEAYQNGMRSLAAREGWPDMTALNGLTLYQAKYVRDAGVLGMINRGPEYALIPTAVLALMVGLSLISAYSHLTCFNFMEKYWNYATNDGSETA